MNWIELNWIEWDWTELSWIESNLIWLDWIDLHFHKFPQISFDWRCSPFPSYFFLQFPTSSFWFPLICIGFHWFTLISFGIFWFLWFPFIAIDLFGFPLMSFDFLWFPLFSLSFLWFSFSGWTSAGIASDRFSLYQLALLSFCSHSAPCSAERHRDEGGGDLEAYASGALRHIVQRGEPTRGRITRSTHLNLPEIPTHPPHGPSAFSSLLSAFVYHFSMVHLSNLSLLNLPSRRQNHFGLIFIRCSFDVRSISI